jgi:ABC-type branched-subunit amino acid transport system permease subunit
VFGAAALILMEEWLPELMNALRPGLGEHWQIVLGPILILIVLYAPRGVWGLIDRRGAGRGDSALGSLVARLSPKPRPEAGDD